MSEKNKVLPSTLYLTATPIGNLDDISARALKVLTECDFIAAEDTRVTAKLLAAYGITKSMVTYEEHSKKSAGETVLRRLKAGESCALVTDAGTPGISDPGEDIVRLCIGNGISVVPVPGCCAAVTALIVSGFSTRRFVFEGFLEGKPNQKKERILSFASEARTVILYEAPHRIAETVSQMAELLGGERRVALCREMTKLNEEVIRLPLAEAAAKLRDGTIRGEFVIVLEGCSDTRQGAFWQNMTVREHFSCYTEQMGLDRMSAIKQVAKDRGVPKGEIYKELVQENAGYTDT